MVKIAFAAMFILIAIWELRCSKPRIEGIVWDRLTGRFTLIKNIVKFMKAAKNRC
jgi:hypothetical protein